MTFADDQVNAASAFAHTMIVVDDEPIADPAEAETVTKTQTPGRRDAKKASSAPDQPVAEPERKTTHLLDAKALIKSALDLGLVCSVVNPSGDEDNVAKGVAKASIRADIISLDWHMHGDDDGDLACEIIAEILRNDAAIGGRLRLIAIYTGNNNEEKILKQIEARLNDRKDQNNEVVRKGQVLTNETGLRLVWRQKAMLNEKLEGAVSEAQLPQELLAEFAKLSSGLLSNVALATISAMRDTTHHVLSKFSETLDGPFFHHRALLENPSESMDYAVSIVISALKSEVNKSEIAERFTTTDAVKRRLQAMANGSDDFTLRYLKGNQEKEFSFCLDDIAAIIEHGHEKWPEDLRKVAEARKQNASNPKPTKEGFKRYFSTVFSESRDAATDAMMHFSFLTNSRSSELSLVHRTVLPKLELGSVVFSEKLGYLLCLQATCDAVRGDGLFFFVPLVVASASPGLVVPHKCKEGKPNYIGLEVPPKCYTKSLSLNFGTIDSKIGRIPVNFDEKNGVFQVLDAEKNEYRWLANLKYKRALRIAQNVSQQMSRIGFDEFEPFK